MWVDLHNTARKNNHRDRTMLFQVADGHIHGIPNHKASTHKKIVDMTLQTQFHQAFELNRPYLIRVDEHGEFLQSAAHIGSHLVQDRAMQVHDGSKNKEKGLERVDADHN